jgi:hypothetical protein
MIKTVIIITITHNITIKGEIYKIKMIIYTMDIITKMIIIMIIYFKIKTQMQT